MKNEGTTKKEQNELLLREQKKTSQRDLARLKKRKILTSEELIKFKEARQWWDERLYMKKKLTPLEELQFYSWLDKRRLVGPKVERMIFNCKPGPYDQSIKELRYFDIDVRDLLLRILKLKEERDSFHNQVHELQDQLISALEKESKRLEATIVARNTTIEQESYRIRHSDDYNEDMEAQLQDILSGSEPRDILSGSDSKKSPLRVV